MNKLDPGVVLGEQSIMTQFDSVNTSLQNICTSAAGLTIGTSANTAVKIANTVTYVCGGAFKSKTTAEVAFTATTHDIAANASSVQERCYLLTLSSSGTPTITAGTIATGSGAALLPERPATGTPIGSVRIAVAAGSTSFTAGTTALNSGALTVTYTDLGYLAPRFDAAQ
jgi:hypothetical protein